MGCLDVTHGGWRLCKLFKIIYEFHGVKSSRSQGICDTESLNEDTSPDSNHKRVGKNELEKLGLLENATEKKTKGGCSRFLITSSRI